MNLHQTLLQKADKQELAHFYIVETSAPLEEAQILLKNFVHEFIRDYYHQVEGQKHSLNNLMDHPDVIVLGGVQVDKKESTFYSVVEAETLSRFFEWRAVQSQRKFAVIPDAHRINQIVANKWLKLLEEPPLLSTIFLLNPKKTKLLDTIHSRAIHLRLPGRKQEGNEVVWKEFLQDVQENSLSSFLEKYSRGDLPLSFYVQELLRWETDRSDRPEVKEILATWVKSFEEMELFHQPSATKWTLFYSHLKEHVLPRL